MRAVVVDRPGSFSLAEIAEPDPGEREVLVRVERCGVCGTDRHLLAGNNPLARFPVVPGHEFAGEVVGLGPGVSRLRIGDRVAVDPSRSCEACDFCRGGRPNLCPRKGGHGSRLQGAMAELVACREGACVPLALETSYELGAMAEPLACVLHGIDAAGPLLGDRVLVTGLGPIGLLSARLARHAGASEVVGCDPDFERRRLATRWVDRIAPDCGDADLGSFGLAIDASGATNAIEQGIARLRRGGRSLVLGVAAASARIRVSPSELNWRELRIIGSMSLLHSFERAVDLLAGPFSDADWLVSGVLGLERFGEAIDRLGHGADLKLQINPAT